MNHYLNPPGFVLYTCIPKSLEKSCTFYHKKRGILVCLLFDAPRGTDDLFSYQLEMERRVIDLPVNAKLLPEDHQG